MSYVEWCKKHGQYHGELCVDCFEELETENLELKTILRGLMGRSREYANDYEYTEEDNYSYWYERAKKILNYDI